MPLFGGSRLPESSSASTASLPKGPKPDTVGAETEFIQALRAEVSDRREQQQQVAVVAGATMAIAASLLGGDLRPSPWLSLGLSVLFMAFGFSMLDKDRHIIAAVDFILEQKDSPQASMQAMWENSLRDKARDVSSRLSGARALLRAMSNYAIPVLGTIGAAWAFVADEKAPWGLVLIPGLLAVMFVMEAWQVFGEYQRLGGPNPTKDGHEPTKEGDEPTEEGDEPQKP